MFVSISQVIGSEDRLRNNLYCVGWGVKLYSNKPKGKQKGGKRRGRVVKGEKEMGEWRRGSEGGNVKGRQE